LPVCARHPDRPTGLSCTRCERPACPSCLREASVGYQCVDCVAAGRQNTRRPVTVAGARLSTQPIVVFVLIAVNVLVFVATAVDAGSALQSFRSNIFGMLALVPAFVADGEWWRLITSGFLHIQTLHLAMNMIALWIIGKDLEVVLGRLRFVAVYGLSLLGGSTAVFLFADPAGPVAGASGAVYGLMGGIAVAAFRLRLSLRPVLVVIALNIVLSLGPGISLLGHLGGLVIGTLSTAALIYAPRDRRSWWQAGAVAVLLVVLLSMLIVRDLQFTGMV
jgi:membrane associated rhomboid family serine protease